MVIPAMNRITNLLRGLISTPDSFMTFSAANADTAPSKAIGPNG